TAREAIGGDSMRRPEPPPVKRSRGTSKPTKAAARQAVPPAQPAPAPAPAPAPSPQRGGATAPSPATAYDAMVGFASAALRQNLDLGARLARCTSPMEAFAAQTAHAATFAQNLFVVSLKLMQLGVAAAAWTSLRRPDAH